MPTLRKVHDPSPPLRRGGEESEEGKRSSSFDDNDSAEAGGGGCERRRVAAHVPRMQERRVRDSNRARETELVDRTARGAEKEEGLVSMKDGRGKKFGALVVGGGKASDCFVERAAGDPNRDLKRDSKRGATTKDEDETRSVGGKKRKRANRDPNAPRRPKTCYNFFASDARPRLAAEGVVANGVAIGALSRALGERWRALSAEERSPYERMAADDRERYEAETAAYEAGRLASNGGDGSVVPPRALIGPTNKRRKRYPDAPKRAPGGFIYYQNEMRPEVKRENPSLAGSGVREIIFKRWNALTAEERRPYEDRGLEYARRYQEEMTVRAAKLRAKGASGAGGNHASKEGCGSRPPEEQPVAINISISSDQRRMQALIAAASSEPSAPKQTAADRFVNRSEPRVGSPGRSAGETDVPLEPRERSAKDDAATRNGAATAAPALKGRKIFSGRQNGATAEETANVAKKGLKNDRAIDSQPAAEGCHGNTASAATAPVFAQAEEAVAKKAIDFGLAVLADASATIERAPIHTNNITGDENKENDIVRTGSKKSNVFGGLEKCTVAARSKGGGFLAEKMIGSGRKRSSPTTVEPSSFMASKMKRPSVKSRAGSLFAGTLNNSMVKMPRVAEKKRLAAMEFEVKTAKANENDDVVSAARSFSCDSARERGQTPETQGNSSLASMQNVPIGKEHEGDVPGFDDSNVSMDITKTKDFFKAEVCIENTRGDEPPADARAKVVSFLDDSTAATACFHDEKTQMASNTTIEKENARCDADASMEPTVDASNVTLAARSTRLELVPISKVACQSTLREMGVAYSEPEYLVPASLGEYDITRNAIALETRSAKVANINGPQSALGPSLPKTVALGRNRTTGIEWSAVSRRLCDVSLTNVSQREKSSSGIAFLIMRKSAYEHAVCLNGREFNVPVDKRFPLKNGDVLSLYGPAGFAYRVEIIHDGAG